MTTKSLQKEKRRAYSPPETVEKLPPDSKRRRVARGKRLGKGG